MLFSMLVHRRIDAGPHRGGLGSVLRSRALLLCPVYTSLCLLIPVSRSVPLLLPLQPRFKASVSSVPATY